jgi:acyl carrier protein
MGGLLTARADPIGGPGHASNLTASNLIAAGASVCSRVTSRARQYRPRLPSYARDREKGHTMDVAATIKEILSDDIFVEVPVAEMDPDDSLRDVYGLDSLGFVELRVQAQNRFGVQILDADYSPENFATIRTVSALVERLLAETPAASGRA